MPADAVRRSPVDWRMVGMCPLEIKKQVDLVFLDSPV
jgi:hypothetical protein